MTPYGSLETERKLEQLHYESATRTGREKAGSSLALAYGIRAQVSEFQLGDPEEAILLYWKASDAAPNEARWLERAAASTYHLARALDFYQKYYISLSIGTSIVKLQEMVDRKESPSDLYQGALISYILALHCDPYHVPALIGRARTFAELGKEAEASKDWEEAVKVLNRALTVDPNDLTSRNERAEAFEALGQLEKAIEDLKYTVALEKDEEVEKRIEKLEEKLQSDAKGQNID